MEHDRAIRLNVFAQRDPARNRNEKQGQLGLALTKRQLSQIVTVEFEQIEGIQDNLAVEFTGMEAIEQGKSGFRTTYDGLTDDKVIEIAKNVATANSVSFADIGLAPAVATTGLDAIEIKIILTPGSELVPVV